MEVYKAVAWSNSIEVDKYEVIDETGKQFKLSNGKRLNKTFIGSCDSVGHGYGLTKDEAINAVKNMLQSEIDKYENWVKNLKNKINSPIKELYK